MSVPSGKIRCHGCNYEGVVQHRPVTLQYALPDGASVQGYREFGWCNICDGIRDIESKLDQKVLQAELQALTPQRGLGGILRSAMDRALGGGTDDRTKDRDRLNGLLRVAQNRSAPQRCLNCGSTSVLRLAFDDEGNCPTFQHHCGGHLYRLPGDPNAPRFSYRPEVIPLDLNGNRLDKVIDYGDEFLSYLVDDWQFREKYAKAFLIEYGDEISRLYDKGLKRLEASLDLSRPENRLLAAEMPDPRAFALVAQAFSAYANDLQKGKHRGKPVEVAIWAILWNRSDLLETLNPDLAKYITDNQDTVFKSIYETAFKE
jgi:hypothetical protein